MTIEIRVRVSQATMTRFDLALCLSWRKYTIQNPVSKFYPKSIEYYKREVDKQTRSAGMFYLANIQSMTESFEKCVGNFMLKVP